jgi:hypothetical protein
VTTLKERDRRLVSMRFGLDGREPMTWREIARAERISQQRVHQLVDRAITRVARRFRLAEAHPLVSMARDAAPLPPKPKAEPKPPHRQPPVGFVYGPNGLIPDVDEQETLARIRSMHELGMSAHRIAAELTASGVKSKRGNDVWRPQVIYNIVARQVLAPPSPQPQGAP